MELALSLFLAGTIQSACTCACGGGGAAGPSGSAAYPRVIRVMAGIQSVPAFGIGFSSIFGVFRFCEATPTAGFASTATQPIPCHRGGIAPFLRIALLNSSSCRCAHETHREFQPTDLLHSEAKIEALLALKRLLKNSRNSGMHVVPPSVQSPAPRFLWTPYSGSLS